jgi:hypothetical protein
MRTLTSTLEAAQKAVSVNALVKLVLTSGATTYTYTKTRILDIDETENGNLQSCKITLDNADGTLTDLDLRGYKGVLSLGAMNVAGEEYSPLPYMWVTAQQFDSTAGKLTCVLTLSGICNLMADDKANASYIPEDTDTKTPKTLIGEILAATMACFNHCTAYSVVWDSEDDLIDTYKPADSFRIYTGGNRLSAINRLLDYTKCVMRAGDDGKIHIFVPTTTGTTYSYEYALGKGEHNFFAKALRNRLTIPNYVKVMSRTDDTPQYSGTATDAESYAKLPKTDYYQMRLESDAQAAKIAAAKLAKAQLWCEAGSASVPMNVGAETYDYVKVTDSREGDSRVGNIGTLRRHYTATKNEWRMSFVFGNWQTVRKALADLGITSDDLENYFSRLSVGDLYVEHIYADSLDMVWIDPEGNIDLDKIGDTLDNLPDGEIYARVKSLHIDAGQIKLDENVWYKAGYDPSTKMTGTSLDDLPDGTVYHRVKSAALTAGGFILLDQVTTGTYGLVRATDISAGHIRLSYCVGDLDDIDNGTTYGKLLLTDIASGHILLSSLTQVSGSWYDESGVEIDATHGINIYGVNNALTTRQTKTGTIQCYVGADGKIYAGAGSIFLDSNGLTIKGAQGCVRLQLTTGTTLGYLYASSLLNAPVLEAASGYTLQLISTGTESRIVANAKSLRLSGNNTAPTNPLDGDIVFHPATGEINYYAASNGGWRRLTSTTGWV